MSVTHQAVPSWGTGTRLLGGCALGSLFSPTAWLQGLWLGSNTLLPPGGEPWAPKGLSMDGAPPSLCRAAKHV